MNYRDFGNTGIKISALGFGCMRLPMIRINDKEVVDEEKTSELLLKGYELGINYFDTAYFYCIGLSEAAVGKAIKPIRNKIYVSTKSPGHLMKNTSDYRRILEEQLKNLDIEYIDFYHYHGISYDGFFAKDKETNWIKEAQRAKAEGLIKHISFSFHDKPENMIKLIDTGLFESVLCQYNIIDRKNEEAISYASKKGLGVAIMGPVGGGRVSGLPKEISSKLDIEVKSNSELALKFVFANPNVHCALSGMETIEMVNENSFVASDIHPLSESETKKITDMMRENEYLSSQYCSGCKYCMPCPEQVNIAEIFRLMNYYKVYNIYEYSKMQYNNIGNPWVPGKRADACIECGLCESKCPQKLPIIKQLKESHQSLN